MDINSFFATMQELTAKIEPLGKTIKFNFGTEQVFIDGTKGGNIVTKEDKSADCTLTIAFDDFVLLTEGKLDAMKAMMTKKMKLEGDIVAAMKLQTLLGK